MLPGFKQVAEEQLAHDKSRAASQPQVMEIVGTCPNCGNPVYGHKTSSEDTPPVRRTCSCGPAAPVWLPMSPGSVKIVPLAGASVNGGAYASGTVPHCAGAPLQ